MDAYKSNPDLSNLLLTKQFAKYMNESTIGLRRVAGEVSRLGIPIPELSL